MITITVSGETAAEVRDNLDAALALWSAPASNGSASRSKATAKLAVVPEDDDDLAPEEDDEDFEDEEEDFEDDEADEADEEEAEEEAEITEAELLDMGLKELRALAKANDLDLGSAKTKSAIIAKFKEEMELAED